MERHAGRYEELRGVRRRARKESRELVATVQGEGERGVHEVVEDGDVELTKTEKIMKTLVPFVCGMAVAIGLIGLVAIVSDSIEENDKLINGLRLELKQSQEDLRSCRMRSQSQVTVPYNIYGSVQGVSDYFVTEGSVFPNLTSWMEAREKTCELCYSPIRVMWWSRCDTCRWQKRYIHDGNELKSTHNATPIK